MSKQPRTWMENYPLHVVQAIAHDGRPDTPPGSVKVARRELEMRGEAKRPDQLSIFEEVK